MFIKGERVKHAHVVVQFFNQFEFYFPFFQIMIVNLMQKKIKIKLFLKILNQEQI